MNPITEFLFEADSGRKYRRRAEVFIIKDNKIFAGTKHDGKPYNIPGGGIGKSETPEDAAKREAKEEIGILCTDLIKLAPKFTVTLPDIYGGEEEILSKQHKSWMESQKLLGHITYSFRANYNGESEAKTNLGPQDDKYDPILLEPKEWIEKLKELNKEITEPKRQWKKIWNNYTIGLLEDIQKYIDGLPV